jgi:hypothetical protein
MTEKYDGKKPASLDYFLEVLQITEDEFYDILSKHRVYPWEFDRGQIARGQPLPDMNRWDETRVEKPVGPPKQSNGRINTYL